MSKKQIIMILVVLCVAVAGFLFVNKKEPAPVQTTEETTTQTTSTEATAPASTLESDKIYVMYVETCPMCAQALEFLDANYATEDKIVRVDLNTENGKAMLKQCHKKFGFEDVVIPLICAENEYSMGWSKVISKRIDKLVENLSK